MKPGLLLKLLAVNLPLMVAVVAVLWWAVDTLAAGYFMVLMDQYHVNPADTHRMFLSAVHRYMLWASLGGLTLAVVFSTLLTRRLLRPLWDMTGASRRIARGEYGERVTAVSSDEVGELGRAFNAMAENLGRIESLRKTMVADVAHELRTPLSNVRGYLEGLRDGVVAPEPHIFSMLHEEVLRLVRLVNDLGELSRADAARLNLSPRQVDTRELLESTLLLYRPHLEEKSLLSSVTVAPDATTVHGDPGRLAQILRNLLDNACRHATPGGAITLSAARLGTLLRLSVDNQGEEIPAAELPLIFERFYRVDKSRARASGGSGVGLAIVRRLAEAHGGTAGAESGDGHTRVWVDLPAVTLAVTTFPPYR
ncbi:MAG: ATP-binding protein [Nitrospirota bacterium]|nr:ATP-binding protein [Nitrospirota bacterium]